MRHPHKTALLCRQRSISYEELDRSSSQVARWILDRGCLADYKLPERIYFLAELPKGITGKVQRRALKGMLLSRSATA